jgi:hypothetical protein
MDVLCSNVILEISYLSFGLRDFPHAIHTSSIILHLFLQNPFLFTVNEQPSISLYLWGKHSCPAIYIELKSFSITRTAAISQRWALVKALSWGPLLLPVFLKQRSYKLIPAQVNGKAVFPASASLSNVRKCLTNEMSNFNTDSSIELKAGKKK